MGSLSKRLEIRLDPTTMRFLQEISKKKHESIGKLVRSAVRKLYIQDRKKERSLAASHLCELKAPSPDWDRMEEEINGGRA